MKLTESVYECHRISAEIILYIGWLYLRFFLSHLDIEVLLAERGKRRLKSIHHRIVLFKFWIHIPRDEQLRRFREREVDLRKHYKITEAPEFASASSR